MSPVKNTHDSSRRISISWRAGAVWVMTPKAYNPQRPTGLCPSWREPFVMLGDIQHLAGIRALRRAGERSGGGGAMTDVVKAHRVTLPYARSTRWNPSPAELRALTAQMPNARHTE